MWGWLFQQAEHAACSCLCKLLSLLSPRSSDYRQRLFCYSVQAVICLSASLNLFLIGVKYDNIITEANVCISVFSVKTAAEDVLVTFIVTFHYRTLTQTHSPVLTFGSRVKTTLNHHQFLSHCFTLHRETCRHKRHTCSVFSLSWLLWKEFCSPAAAGTSAAPLLLRLLCSCQGICRANRRSVSYPGLQAMTTQSHDTVT